MSDVRCKIETRPLVREVALHEDASKCQTIVIRVMIVQYSRLPMQTPSIVTAKTLLYTHIETEREREHKCA
jgi:hypothetical protein